MFHLFPTHTALLALEAIPTSFIAHTDLSSFLKNICMHVHVNCYAFEFLKFYVINHI